MAPDDFSSRRRRSPPAILATSAEYDQRRLTSEHSPSSSFSSCRSSRPQHHRRQPRQRTTLKPSARQPSSSVSPVHRTYSDPILWTSFGILSPEESSPSSSRGTGDGRGDVYLPRNQTCLTIFQPTPFSLHGFHNNTKVVLSVTVEGSPGPVKAMVKLGDSVEDAIAAVVDIYRKEGRTPMLDRNAAAVESFQLHHSCFSLQSLNKSHKIGEVGGRSFYLRTRNSSSRISACRSSFHLGAEANDVKATATQLIVPPPHPVLDSIMARIGTIAMGTRKLWRMLACMACF